MKSVLPVAPRRKIHPASLPPPPPPQVVVLLLQSAGSSETVTSALHWMMLGTPGSSWQLCSSGATSFTHTACERGGRARVRAGGGGGAAKGRPRNRVTLSRVREGSSSLEGIQYRVPRKAAGLTSP